MNKRFPLRHALVLAKRNLIKSSARPSSSST